MFKRLKNQALLLSSILALLLVVGTIVNLLGMSLIFTTAPQSSDKTIEEYAQALQPSGNTFALSAAAQKSLQTHHHWAMYLDAGGTVVWDYQKPAEVPDRYTVADVASFSRWYLKGYPVNVWRTQGGLFVLGSPKDSSSRYVVSIPTENMYLYILVLPGLLVLNFILMFIVTSLVLRYWYKKRDIARSAWIAGVSHDVRTPLAVIMGHASVLATAPELTVTERQKAAKIQQKSQELGTLIADLNLTNKLEFAMEPLQKQSLSLAALVREVVAGFLNETAADVAIEADISASAAAKMMSGDPALLRRLLENLIRNSLRHNPVRVQIHIGLDIKYGRYRLQIKDNGSGFTPDQLKTLNSKKTRVTTGHGMGLSIVKQVTWSHRGRVRFANEQGAVCRIWLPCKTSSIKGK